MNLVRSAKDLILGGIQMMANTVASLAREHPAFPAKFIPAEQSRIFHVIPKAPSRNPDPAQPLPIPPRDLWENTYDTTEDYLRTGREHVDHLRTLLQQHHATLQPGQHVLELGCATGRLLRWFQTEAGQGEFWGLDINAKYIDWSQQHLSPPFHFATNTTLPHLPFPDASFHLVYAGSVFSHISELVDAWFLELRRILRPGGKLYITVHDNHTIRLLQTVRRHEPLALMLAAHQSRLNALPNGFGMFTIRRSPQGAQVFYDLDYLRGRLNSGFNVLAVQTEAYGHQTGLLLEKK